MGFKRIFIFLFEIFVIYFALKKSNSNYLIKILNVGFLLFIFVSFMSINVFLRPYFITTVPIILIDIAYLINTANNSKKFFVFLFALYLTNQMLGNIYIYKMNRANIEFRAITREFINKIPEDALVGGDLICWFIRPSLDWVTSEKINQDFKNTNKLQNSYIYWFNLPYPAYLRSSLSKKKSVFLSKETNINKRLSPSKNSFKEMQLIHTFENPNYSEIELWKLKIK